MARSLTFRVPLPPRLLHPNGRPGHWAQRARATAGYRRAVCLVALAAMGPERWRLERAALDLEYVFPTRRRRDDDGLVAWFKAGRDGLVDAGLAQADDLEHLRLRRVGWRSSTTEPPGVVVTVEELA